MIAVIDYGMGNLRSVAKALEALGEEPLVTARAEDLRAASITQTCRQSASKPSQASAMSPVLCYLGVNLSHRLWQAASMTAAEKISIALPPEMVAIVRAAVATGE